MTICINLIPILFIRDWLHYLLQINRPQFAYNGSDRLRIFNFKTLTAAGKDDMEGEAKKKAITDTYRDKTKRMFGGTIQQTRHTVTAQGQENGLTESELNGQLGHSTKGSLRHYLKTHQIPKDVNHIHIIQEFGILNILKSLLDKTGLMKELVNSEEIPFDFFREDDFKKGQDKEILSVLRIISNGQSLSIWSVEDEKRYQTLMAKESKGKWKFINGVNTKVEVTEEMFSKELKDLIKKKEDLIWETGKKKSFVKADDKFNETLKNKIEDETDETLLIYHPDKF